MVLHDAADDEDGRVIEPLLGSGSSSSNATIAEPQGLINGYYTIPPPDQKYDHFEGDRPLKPYRRHSIANHHELAVAPLRHLLLPPFLPRRAPQPPVVVDEDAVLRRIDRRLLPLLFLTQALASADAVALASAVFLGGLSQDANLFGSDYRALSAWFYLGYILLAYPTCFFLSTLTGAPATAAAAAAASKRNRSASGSSSFYTSMYSGASSESLSIFFLSSATSDSSSIISTSSDDSSEFASPYSLSPDSPKGAGGGGNNDDDEEDSEGIRFGVARYLGIDTLIWGAVVAATAATSSYAGLAAVRFLLGAAEASVIPALMLVTSTWYTRDEVPLRTGIWFAGGAAGGVVSTALGQLLVFLQGFGGGIENGSNPAAGPAGLSSGRGSDSGSSFRGVDFGQVFLGILPSWNPWRWQFLLLGAATVLWGVVILYRLLDPISSSPAAFPGSAEERQWDLDRVAAAEAASKPLWALSSHARPRPAPGWKWRQARECLRDPQTWLIAAMCLLSQAPLSSTRGLADMVLLGASGGGSDTESGGGGDNNDDPLSSSSSPSTLPMALQITYMLLTMAAMVGTGWLAGRFRSLTCVLVALAVAPAVVGGACVAKTLHDPAHANPDAEGWPPSPNAQILAALLLCTAPAVLPLLLSLVQVNVRGVTKKTTTTALALAAYCVGTLAGPRLFFDDDEKYQQRVNSTADAASSSSSSSYHTAVHAILVCHVLVVVLALTLRGYLLRRNQDKQDIEMTEVIDAIETRAGVSEYTLYRGAVDEDVYHHRHGGQEDQAVYGNDHLHADDFDDMTDWKIPGFQYRL